MAKRANESGEEIIDKRFDVTIAEMMAAIKTDIPVAPAARFKGTARGNERGAIQACFSMAVDALGFWEWRGECKESEGQNWESEKINDSVVYGEISDSILDRQIELALSKKGSKTYPGGWASWKGPVRDWLTMLSVHAEGPKDGHAFLQGAVIQGDRKAQAVPHLDWLVLDLDTGESIAELKVRLRALGLFAVVYTTHSHMKPITEVKKDTVVKFCSKGEPDAKDVAFYLMEEKRYRPAVLVGAEIVKTEHTEKGVMLFLRHQPMPKFRVMLLLKERFVIADRVGTQKDAITEWKERYAGASKLLGCFFDRSCVDPSRLFFTPRHPKGATGYSIEVLAGETLDLDSVERLTNEQIRDEALGPIERAARDVAADAGVEYKTPGLKGFAARFAKRFEIADCFEELAPDTARGSMASGPGFLFKCPNDDAHTDAGNENDKGFFCINASEIEDGGMVAKCMHDACHGLDRLGLLDLFCQEHGIAHADELKEWTYWQTDDPDYVDEAEAFSPPEPMKRAAAMKSLANLPSSEDDEYDDARTAWLAGVGAGVIAGLIKQSDVNDLAKLAIKKAGGTVKAWEADINAAAKAAQLVATKAKAKDSAGALDPETRKRMESLNARYAVIAQGASVRVMRYPLKDDDQPLLYRRAEFEDLEATLGDVDTGKTTAKGDPIMDEAARFWRTWDGRTTFHGGIEFEPAWDKDESERRNVYNLWQGFATKAEPGDWSLLQGHMLDNICQGNAKYRDWLDTWLAHMFQHPGEKMGSAVVVKGKRGTGKSKLFLLTHFPQPPGLVHNMNIGIWQRRSNGSKHGAVSEGPQ